MPHFFNKWQVLIANIFITLNFNLAQKNCPFTIDSIYIPSIKQNVLANIYTLKSKNIQLNFIKYQNQSYLKVIFETLQDTSYQIIERFKSEIEIKSHSKLYYKKNYPIYAEKNQLFFLLLLPPNYIKTIISDGITEIIVMQKNFKLSKKETSQIKDIAQCLLPTASD